MKRLPILILAVLALTIGACTRPGERIFVEAAERYHTSVGAAFQAYVQEDETLSDVEKRIRVNAHNDFGNAIEARKQVAK